MKTHPTSEEKTWAVISHLSALMSGTGMILPAFAWMEYRKKSKYIAFQSLQALCYQSLGYTLWALVALFVITILTIATLPLLRQGESLNLWIASHVLATLALYAVYLLIPIVGAVRCAMGRDFCYPVLGDRLARYIGYDPAADDDSALDESHEERVAVSMGHFGIVYPLWGMLVPFVFLAARGGRSRYLKFESLQIIVFQAISTLMTLGLGALAFLILLAALLPFVINSSAAFGPSMESLFAFLIFLICLMVILLVVPLYQILGQWAGLRVLQGREYRYPLVGRWVEGWLAKRGA